MGNETTGDGYKFSIQKQDSEYLENQRYILAKIKEKIREMAPSEQEGPYLNFPLDSGEGSTLLKTLYQYTPQLNLSESALRKLLEYYGYITVDPDDKGVNQPHHSITAFTMYCDLNNQSAVRMESVIAITNTEDTKKLSLYIANDFTFWGEIKQFDKYGGQRVFGNRFERNSDDVENQKDLEAFYHGLEEVMDVRNNPPALSVLDGGQMQTLGDKPEVPRER